MPKIDPAIYKVTVVSDTVITLGLKKPNAWPGPADEESGAQSLYLMGLKKTGASENELNDPVSIAMVTVAPSVMRGFDKVIYMTGTKTLGINGTGFRTKDMSLVFDPPLVNGVDYVLTVRSSTLMQLTLRTGKKWRSDGQPGPLKLRRINTGAGFLRIDAKYGGVLVAEVQVDLGAHGVRVETTYADQKVYQSSPRLSVKGTGFNETTALNTLKWGNSLRGKGINYTITRGTSEKLDLELAPFSRWRANEKNLPSPLLLLAVNAGAGLVPVGPTEAKKGRRVATVYEDPGVVAVKEDALPTLFRTHTHELWLRGWGFTKGLTEIDFEPKLKVNEDYVLTVFNRTHALVTLLDGKAWGPKAGDLAVAKLNTGAGKVYPRYYLTHGKDDLKDPVVIAKVVDDEDAHASGTFVDRTAGQTIYQSGKVKQLKISGGGFCAKTSDVKLTFDPPLASSAYAVAAVSASEISLVRGAKSKWRESAGALYVTSLQCGSGDTVTFASGQGVAVATILANPTVQANPTRSVYATNTKRLTIKGTGFALYSNAEVTLEPTPRGDYRVANVQDTAIVVELVEGKAWVPAALLDGSNDAPEIRVTEVNTGAGMIEVGDGGSGVAVAKVLKDAEGALCDDSCEFALDGVCDDGTGDASLGRNQGDANTWDDALDDYYDYNYYNDGALNFAYDDFHQYYDDDYYGYEHNYYYDDFYGGVNTMGVGICDKGTDCTDCSAAVVARLSSDKCDNTCVWAHDGSCDDDRTNGPCAHGTDCFDCGPPGASNFTAFDDGDDWWEDDAAYWDGDDYGWDDDYGKEWKDVGYDDDDAKPIAMIRSIAHPREAKEPRTIGEPGAGGIFVVLLQSVVYLTGAVFLCSGVFYVVAQRKAGKDVWAAVPTLDPEDFEQGSKNPMASNLKITPDVAYTGGK